MTRLKGFTDAAPYRGGFLSIGNFDGVHLGHQRIIRKLVESARNVGQPAVVLTFEPHPLTLLRPEVAPPRLTTADSKAELLQELGVDVIIEYPTDRDMLEMLPQEFFDRIVLDELQACGMVEGPNFYFGHGRAGDIHTLRMLCSQKQLDFHVVEASLNDGRPVSSSRIREALQDGDIATASLFLGREYAVRGIVERGAGRGRSLGYPTANLGQIETLLPADGVYAGWARIDDTRHPAVAHFGTNPTFSDDTRKFEIHLLDHHSDLYDQRMSFAFVSRLRPPQQFESVDKLKTQIQQDIESARSVLGP